MPQLFGRIAGSMQLIDNLPFSIISRSHQFLNRWNQFQGATLII
jgi:hypothetical protein